MASIFSKTYAQDLIAEHVAAMNEACMDTFMDKAEALNIIESMFKSGLKSPGLFKLPEIMVFKSKLKSCNSPDEVVALLETYRGFLTKAYGLSEAVFNGGVHKINGLVMHEKPTPARAVPPVAGSLKAPCSCGSGRRLENCHGR